MFHTYEIPYFLRVCFELLFNRASVCIALFWHRKELFSQVLRFHPSTATSINH